MIYDTRNTFTDTRLNFQVLEEFSSGCRSLEVLHFRGALSMTDRGLTNILKNCENLTVLSLPFCVLLTDTAFLGIASMSRDLPAVFLYSPDPFFFTPLVHAPLLSLLSRRNRNLSSSNSFGRPWLQLPDRKTY